MLTCNGCGGGLVAAGRRGGVVWACPGCDTKAVALPVLRRLVPRPVVQRLWLTARDPDTPLGQPCPACRRPARAVATDEAVVVDVCPRCQMVYFDPQELDALPRAPDPDAARQVTSPAAVEAMARFELEHQRAMAQPQEPLPLERGPSEPWKWLPGLLGLPVEHDRAAADGRPWAIWGVGAVILVVGLLTLPHIDAVAAQWGLVPAEPLAHGGLNFLTSFFLHASWLHLLVNLYFLLVFGDDVEGLVGPARLLLLLLAATLLGDVLDIAFTPHGGGLLRPAQDTVPTIGSSGGISGVLVFYALAFPRVRIGLLFHYVFWVRLPAWGYLVVWLALQALGAAWGGGSVAYLAHLGGGLAGAAFFLLWRWEHQTA